MTSSAAAVERCPGCGALHPVGQGPTHAYIGASAGCWSRYGLLLALEYERPALMRWHRLTVDAYAAQHPGVPGRRSAQSVHVHLVALYLSLERGVDEAAVRRAMRTLAHARGHPWLAPPADLATRTGLEEAIAAAGTPAYGETVGTWALEVWRAWSMHHPAIHAEAEAALTSH